MLPAVRRRAVDLGIEGRLLSADVTQTALLENIYHAVLNMIFAERRRLDAFEVECWNLCAQRM